MIGEANLKKAEKEKKTDGKKGAGKKRKAKKDAKSSKKQKVSDNAASEAKEKKPKREAGKWVMGKSIQICELIICWFMFFVS